MIEVLAHIGPVPFRLAGRSGPRNGPKVISSARKSIILPIQSASCIWSNSALHENDGTPTTNGPSTHPLRWTSLEVMSEWILSSVRREETIPTAADIFPIALWQVTSTETGDIPFSDRRPATRCLPMSASCSTISRPAFASKLSSASMAATTSITPAPLPQAPVA